MEETALEWFYKEINKLNVGDDARMFIAKLLERAKEMEKQERMYSEEEVINLLQEMNDWPTICEGRSDIEEWFEQFKKKIR